jgi:Fe2+ transport system protein FeoA
MKLSQESFAAAPRNITDRLCTVSKGSSLRVIEIPQSVEGTRLIRLGVVKGAVIRCLEKLPGGTVVVALNRQEIAIGSSLTKTILVESVNDKPLAGPGEKHA